MEEEACQVIIGKILPGTIVGSVFGEGYIPYINEIQLAKCVLLIDRTPS